MAIKITGSVDEMEMAVKRELVAKLKEMQDKYAKTKEVYESLARELGAKDADDFAQKIAEQQKLFEKNLAAINKSKENIKKNILDLKQKNNLSDNTLSIGQRLVVK